MSFVVVGVSHHRCSVASREQPSCALDAEPTIMSMNRELDAIREKELRKTLVALPDLTREQRDDIDDLTKRIVRSILCRSMAEINHEIGHHDPHTVLHLVKRLFGIKEAPETGIPETEHAMGGGPM